MRLLMGLSCCVMLVGCAAATPAPLPMVEPPPLPPAPTITVVDQRRVLSEEELRPLIASEPKAIRRNPVTIIQQATKQATMTADEGRFVGGTLQYRFRPEAIYDIRVAFRGVTDVRFQPGEIIRGYSGLSEQEWEIQRIDAEQASDTSHLLLIPKEAPRHGRMAVMTSKGIYALDVRSTETVGLAAVTWIHPEGPKDSRPVKDVSDVVHVGYTIEVVEGAPAWTPVRVWDRGGQTFLEMSPQMAYTQAPLVYVGEGDAPKRLVNYTVKDRMYIVERIAPAFELRLGHEKGAAEVVRVARSAEYRAVRCPGMAGCPDR